MANGISDEHTIESILIADCGTVVTKLLLLERVEDSYRFVAQAESLTTMNAPWNDLSVGVVEAIEEIEATIGRTLYSQGRLITPRHGMTGVDAFVVILSAPEPLHVILAGLVREMSLESARRALSSTYTTTEAVLSREGGPHHPQETWARSIRDLTPDILFLVGGVDGGASRPVLELAEAIALAASMQEEDQRPTVLYAGNADLRQRLTKLLGNITRVEVAENVHPSIDTEHLGPTQTWLETYYIEERLKKTTGVETLSDWSRHPLLPTATAFARVVEFLWHREGHDKSGVLGIDVGAANTTVAATFEDRTYVSIYSRSIAFGALEWIKDHGLETVMRWIPEDLEEETVLEFLHNRELRPWTIPQDPTELWIEQAVAREMLRGALDVAVSTWDTGAAKAQNGIMPFTDPIIISGGGMVHMPRPGQALLIVLDGLQPVGISTILLDVNRAAPALGAVAGLKPLAASSALEAGTLAPLGTVISPTGKGRRGEIALRMRIAYEDGGELNVEARCGEIEIWPLLPGQRATLDIRPSRRVDIGFGPGHGGKIEAIGGMVGLVVDARGRPFSLPENADERRELLHRWIWDVGG